MGRSDGLYWATAVEETLKDNPAISIVVPVYNEEESVEPLYQKIRGACSVLGSPYEMVFVDDGSCDRTFGILASIHEQDPSVRVVRFRKNFGQTAAMAAGFEHARGELIVSMDGDLQNDPADIQKLLDKLNEDYDVVCGWRKERKDKLISRKIPSIIANRLIGMVTGVHIHDNGCSLKAYRASTIKNVVLYGEMHRFIPAMSTLTGARIAEIVVNHHPRRFGTSKYGIGRVWRVALDIVTIKMLSGFSSRPAVWFGLFSFPWLVLAVSALFAAIKLYHDSPLNEWFVMFTVSFLFSFLAAHLLALGMIGELFVRAEDSAPKKSLRPVTVLEV
jgi:glycosyltransferase involved in cell wall biosynthesis